MPVELYLKSVGILVDVIIRAVLIAMSELPGWTKQEGHQLRYLLSLIEKVEVHFQRISGVGKNKSIEKVSAAKLREKLDDRPRVKLTTLLTAE